MIGRWSAGPVPLEVVDGVAGGQRVAGGPSVAGGAQIQSLSKSKALPEVEALPEVQLSVGPVPLEVVDGVAWSRA